MGPVIVFAPVMGRILWGWCFAWWLLVSFATSARTDKPSELGAVRVCVRPPNLEPGVGQWAYPHGKEHVVTDSEQVFREKSRGNTIYIFDPAAPAENTKLLPIPHNTLACTARVLPMKAPSPPPEDAAPPPSTSGPKKDEAPRPAGTRPAPAAKDEAPDPLPQPIARPRPPPQEPANPLPRGGVTAHWPKSVLPMKAKSGSSTAAGSTAAGSTGGKAPHKVAKKTLFEKLAEQVAIAGAIANTQMNADLHRPDGKRFGIVGGTNPNGPNNPAAQASAGAVLVAAAALSAGASKLVKKLETGLANKTPLLYKEMKEVADDVAKELATKLGPALGKTGASDVRAGLAEALSQNGAIGPYSVMRQFTDELGAKWQAHHILEVQFAKKFKLGNPDKVPSVILTDAQHKIITAKLATRTANAKTPQELWQAYQEVYKNYPAHWLESIKPYFVKGK